MPLINHKPNGSTLLFVQVSSPHIFSYIHSHAFHASCPTPFPNFNPIVNHAEVTRTFFVTKAINVDQTIHQTIPAKLQKALCLLFSKSSKNIFR